MASVQPLSPKALVTVKKVLKSLESAIKRIAYSRGVYKEEASLAEDAAASGDGDGGNEKCGGGGANDVANNEAVDHNGCDGGEGGSGWEVGMQMDTNTHTNTHIDIPTHLTLIHMDRQLQERDITSVKVEIFKSQLDSDFM